MKIGELAKRSGLSAHTIRYYERIGLLPYADRDQSGQRDYDASILVWIEFLHRMKTTGMPIREMLRYAALRAGGVETEAEVARCWNSSACVYAFILANCKTVFSSSTPRSPDTPAWKRG